MRVGTRKVTVVLPSIERSLKAVLHPISHRHVRGFDLVEDLLDLGGPMLCSLRLAICFCMFFCLRFIAVTYKSKTFFLDDFLAKKSTSLRKDLIEKL
jgi:hypothetical protein